MTLLSLLPFLSLFLVPLAAMTLPDLLAQRDTIGRLTARLRAAIARLLATDHDVDVKVALLREQEEAFDLMGEDHHRKVAGQFRDKWRPARELAAGAARYALE